MTQINRIIVIGLGGIGCALIDPLCRYLNYNSSKKIRLLLVDGDRFKRKNVLRQSFKESGNKAQVKAKDLARTFQRLSIRWRPEYVTGENIGQIIEEGDLVFLAVDNHPTRNLVNAHCQTLDKVVLISGGNELTDGNVQIYIRQKGKDITDDLTKFHPEIAHPQGKSPAEMSCAELAKAGQAQLLFTNLAIASAMLNAFYAFEQQKLTYNEVYLDIVMGKSNPIQRGEKDG
jgi:molybdopterin/thiamine biosynthesis adenylyltransferase